MKIMQFDGDRFVEKTYQEVFGVTWEAEEEQCEFLKKAEFFDCSDSFGGILELYHRTSFSKKEGYLVQVNLLETSCHEFFVTDFLALIKFFKFLGMNFYEEFAEKNRFGRIMDIEEIDDDCGYTKVSAINEEKVFVTSDQPIRTHAERREIHRRIKEKREKEKLNKTK